MKKQFYVYLLHLPDGMYYVGKGSGSRLSSQRRVYKPLSYQHWFVDSEDEAFRLEDKIWCEMTKRGFEFLNKRRPERYGFVDERSGAKLPEETKLKISESVKRHYANLPEEVKLERNERRKASLKKTWTTISTSKRTQHKTNCRQGQRNRTPQVLQRRSEKFAETVLKRTIEQKEQLSEKLKDTWANLSEEVKQERSRKLSQSLKGRGKKLTFRGQIKTIVEWAEEVGISVEGLRYRLSSGWSLERALTTPNSK